MLASDETAAACAEVILERRVSTGAGVAVKKVPHVLVLAGLPQLIDPNRETIQPRTCAHLLEVFCEAGGPESCAEMRQQAGSRPTTADEEREREAIFADAKKLDEMLGMMRMAAEAKKAAGDRN